MLTEGLNLTSKRDPFLKMTLAVAWNPIQIKKKKKNKELWITVINVFLNDKEPEMLFVKLPIKQCLASVG